MARRTLSRRNVLALGTTGVISSLITVGCATPVATPAPAQPAAPAAQQGAATPAPQGQVAPAKPATGAAANKIVFAFNSSQSEVQSAWNPIRDAFNKQHPNTEVEFIVTPTSAEHAQKVLAMFAGGTPPDIVYLAASRDFQRTASQNVLLDLDQYIKRDNFRLDDFMPVSRQSSLYCNRQYGMPIHLSYDVVYYNKTMFQKAGLKTPNEYQAEGKWNTDTLLDVGKTLSGGEGATRTFAITRRTGLHAVNAWIWTFGGEYLSEDMNTWLLTDDPKAVQALQFLVDMVRVHKISPADDDMQGLGDMFLTGRVGMTIGGRFLISQLREIKDFEIGMELPPAGPEGKLVTREGPVVVSIAKDSRQQDAAWNFGKFFASIEGQTLYVAGGRGSSGHKAIFDSPEFKNLLLPWEDPEIYRKGVELARVQVATKWQEINKIFDDQMALAYLGNKTVPEATATMKAEIPRHLGENC
jgi:multiple sugar transport system substrate-binding protein